MEDLGAGPKVSEEDIKALSGLSEYLTRSELHAMLIGSDFPHEQLGPGFVEQIFQVLDKSGSGRVSRFDVLKNVHLFFPEDREGETDEAAPAGPPGALPSPKPLPSLSGARDLAAWPRSASGPPLGSHAWELLHRIYRRLAWKDSMVSTMELIEEIRRDVHVRSERLLERPVVGIDFGQGPSISLDAALQHVARQVSQSKDFEMVTWERFNWLLVEAQRFFQEMPPPPPLEERVLSPARSPPNRWFLTQGASCLAGCPNPEEEPGASIESRPKWRKFHVARACACQ